MNPVVDVSKVYVSLGFKVRYPNTDFFIKRGLAGKVHRGIDFAPKPEFVSTPLFIAAPVTGIVVFAGFHTQFGNMVVIKSQEGDKLFLHMMCHLRKISNQVIYNKQVLKGTLIGIMGKTGTATGVHLHYQVEQETNNEWQSHPWVQGNWSFINPQVYCT
jgi:murein DD-endopeptidase MepM/ murein hydrolase activator NlpD